MPHGIDVEHENNPKSISTYECLRCGEIVEAKTHPLTCDCGGGFQNRAKSLE
ncbi:rubrerythrin-like domain-containing protein [Halarchaeum salinum]|uniref:rubrerythrin-like domain-containing protein n=1 Tax=Halarchaeum salinum TaxID=489912 RepID=UPI001B882CDD